MTRYQHAEAYRNWLLRGPLQDIGANDETLTAIFYKVALFLAAAVVAVPIAQRAGLGSVLGYLLAGVAVALGAWFNQWCRAILHFSEFRIVTAALSDWFKGLTTKRCWQMRHMILGLGGAQVLITTLIYYRHRLSVRINGKPAW